MIDHHYLLNHAFESDGTRPWKTVGDYLVSRFQSHICRIMDSKTITLFGKEVVITRIRERTFEVTMGTRRWIKISHRATYKKAVDQLKAFIAKLIATRCSEAVFDPQIRLIPNEDLALDIGHQTEAAFIPRKTVQTISKPIAVPKQMSLFEMPLTRTHQRSA